MSQTGDSIGEDDGTVTDSASSTYRLLNYGEVPSPQQQEAIRKPIHFIARIENALRQWGLSTLYIFFAEAFSLVREYGRVAIFQDRFAATLAVPIHLLPIVGTLVITWFVWHEYYIGGELAGAVGYDKEKFLGLQFAAKVHELFMVGSLSTIVFTMVRHELTLGEGVPFGSLSAGLEISNITFFLSKEFFSILAGNFSTLGKKIFFIVTILLCTVLGLSVAPASATVLQPVLAPWPAGGTDIWLNSTSEQMFPSTLDDTHTLGPICAVSGSNNECPSAQWQTLSGEYLSQLPTQDQIVNGLMSRSPVSFTLRGRSSMLSMAVHVRAPYYYDAFSNGFSVASVPHVAMADAMVLNTVFWDLASRNSTAHNEYRFYYRKEEQYSMPATNALTFARCQETIYEAGSVMLPRFPDIRHADFLPTPINNTNVQDWVLSTVSNKARPDLLWFDLPANFSKSASIGVVASIPINSANSKVQIWGCMMDARWADTVLSAQRINRVAGGEPAGFGGSWMFDRPYPRAMIRPSFAQYLNPRLPSANSTVFEEMAISGGLWNRETLQGNGTAQHLETILNLMVANGMARTAPYTAQQGNITDFDNGNGPWWRGFMPIPPQVFGPGGNAYDITAEQQTSFYRLHLQAFALGYAYTKSNGAAWFSIVILLVYVVVATIFVTVSVVSGVTSSSWESTTELMVLALMSPPPDSLKNTAAGVSTIRSYRERYCLVAEGNRVQLKHWERKLPKEKRVQPNVVYG